MHCALSVMLGAGQPALNTEQKSAKGIVGRGAATEGPNVASCRHRHERQREARVSIRTSPGVRPPPSFKATGVRLRSCCHVKARCASRRALEGGAHLSSDARFVRTLEIMAVVRPSTANVFIAPASAQAPTPYATGKASAAAHALSRGLQAKAPPQQTANSQPVIRARSR